MVILLDRSFQDLPSIRELHLKSLQGEMLFSNGSSLLEQWRFIGLITSHAILLDKVFPSLYLILLCLGIYLDRETFVSLLWTAHGVKLWPSPAPATMEYILDGETIVRAMPRLSFLLSDELLNKLNGELQTMGISLYEFSLSEQRHVRRIPLKPIAITDDEAKHLAQSLDGLSAFDPV